MASTTAIPIDQAQVKLSFAKVAASAHKPQNTKEMSSKTRTPAANPQPAVPAPLHGEMPKVQVDAVDDTQAPEKAGNTATRTSQWANNTGQQAPLVAESKTYEPEKPRSSIASVKFSAAEDGSTQLSSSEGSAKPPSIDGKSVASATTFALDEKESLRPDDSASLRAVEEEDAASPPDSVQAGSRGGSDSGARAFHDQLQEIDIMGPRSQRGVPPTRFANANGNGGPTLYDPNQPSNGITRPIPQPLNNNLPTTAGSQDTPAIPDEKLIEALQSPRDRLFVMKIEQDFIDFIKDSRENEYSLPSCNTFYRMLAHRLADYYLLGHVVDSTMTGVKITRTPCCRIPPPLSQMVDSSKTTNTPPVDVPARKIMRRGDDAKSGTNTAANSENPSKTTSEVGGSDGGNDNTEAGAKDKDKSTMTREEREARYREARQRIFGSAESEENETAEAAGSGEEKGASRSSSASGKKKNNKKQRNYDDDGFEARSRFNAYYPNQYPVSGYGGDGAVYYSGFSGQIPTPQFSGMNQHVTPSTSYNNGYPVMMPQDGQSQYSWTGQQYPSPNPPIAYPNYGPMQNGYDLSADFQRGMQSFQTAGVQSQVTPKMANPPMASYQDTYQPQAQHVPMNSGWAPQMHQQQTSYPTTHGSYAQNGPANRPMSAPIQGPMPNSYPYGQFPPTPFSGKPNRNQHPIPGSFNRQQFNPQSQAFIPGGRNMPFPMQPNMSQGPMQGMNGHTGFQMPPAGHHMPNSMPSQMHNPTQNPISNQMPNQMSNQMPNQTSNQMPNQMSNQMPNQMSNQMPNQTSNQMPNQMSNHMQNQLPRSSPPMVQAQTFGSPLNVPNTHLASPAPYNNAAQTPQVASPQATPVSQGSSQPSTLSSQNESVIAKYGTPSHLPARPPAVSAQQKPPQFNLPGNNFSSMPRVVSNMGPGYTTGSPVPGLRSASGPNIPNNSN